MTASDMYARPSSPDPEFLASLTRRSRLELGAYETSPRTARGHIARVLEEWSLAEFREVTSLIASELITNSLLQIAKYTWEVLPPVRLWLRGGPPGVTLLVWDPILAAPVPRVAGENDESGRGLAIVAELSAACGFYHAADPGGKVTWAVITTP
jgi:serine/threonine-protein kinase RsbW